MGDGNNAGFTQPDFDCVERGEAFALIGLPCFDRIKPMVDLNVPSGVNAGVHRLVKALDERMNERGTLYRSSR